jgi:hypothetical protein
MPRRYRSLALLLLILLAPACGEGTGGGPEDSSQADASDTTVTFDAHDAADQEDVGPSTLCKPYLSFEIPSYGPVRSPAIDEDGTLYVASGDRVSAINSLGIEAWFAQVEPGEVLGTPALLDGALYVGSSVGHVYKLNPASGYSIWTDTLDLQQAIHAAPVHLGRSIVFAGQEHAIFIWQDGAVPNVGKAIACATPPLQPIGVGSRVLIAEGGRLHLLDEFGEGEARALLEGDLDHLAGTPAALDEQRVVLGGTWGDTRGLLVHHLIEGTTTPFPMAGLVGAPQALVVESASRVLGVSTSGEAFRVDLETGALERFVLGGSVVAHPLLANDGLIYLAVALEDQVTLQARDLDLALRWSTSLQGRRLGGVAIARDGTVLFPVDLTLRGFRCASSGLWGSPWPKLQRDHANRGWLEAP